MKAGKLDGVWQDMACAARRARDHAFKQRPGTLVGASVMDTKGQIHVGCNIETPWHSGAHAEVSAISAMISAGSKVASKIIVVSNRALFTPCGSCLDWIYMVAAPDLEVAYWNCETDELRVWLFSELMPFYPRR
jgi:cytidine deaminase